MGANRGVFAGVCKLFRSVPDSVRRSVNSLTAQVNTWIVLSEYMMETSVYNQQCHVESSGEAGDDDIPRSRLACHLCKRRVTQPVPVPPISKQSTNTFFLIGARASGKAPQTQNLLGSKSLNDFMCFGSDRTLPSCTTCLKSTQFCDYPSVAQKPGPKTGKQT